MNDYQNNVLRFPELAPEQLSEVQCSHCLLRMEWPLTIMVYHIYSNYKSKVYKWFILQF